MPPGTKTRVYLSNFPNWDNIKFAIKTTISFYSVFDWVKALRPSQQFFSHVGTFSWVEPVLSNEDEVSLVRFKTATL